MKIKNLDLARHSPQSVECNLYYILIKIPISTQIYMRMQNDMQLTTQSVIINIIPISTQNLQEDED